MVFLCVLEAPSAPINVTPGTTTNSTVVITWNSPQGTDGLPVDSYVVYLSSDGSKEQIRTMDNSTSVVIKNLLPALSYTVEVAAVTQRLERFFEGRMSDPVTFTSGGSKFNYVRIINFASYVEYMHKCYRQLVIHIFNSL